MQFVSLLLALLLMQPSTFTRSVRQKAPGAQRISPDVALLSGSAFADLRDLRFFDSRNTKCLIY
jgi:hypothetical protein